MRNRFIWIFIISFIFLSSVSFGAKKTTEYPYKKRSSGVIAGLNIAKMLNSSDKFTTLPFWGFSVGGFYENRFDKRSSITAEWLLSIQGSRQRTTFTPEVYTNVNYYAFINFPIMYGYRVTENLVLKIGIQPGINFMRVPTQKTKRWWFTDGEFFPADGFDLSIPIGITYNFNFGLLIDAKYTASLIPIRVRNLHNEYFHIRHRYFTLSLGWRF